MSRENKFVKREKWSKDFGSWFRDILLSAEILDYRYPIKGFGVWMPYGFKIRQNILQIMRDLLDATGHNEVLFPTLIPEYLLAKEAEHIRSFEEECYWVTHGGSTPLQVRYALRPTSETAIMPMVRLWVRSHADLPVKLYQIVSIFRYETKATRPILRMREVASFKEAHTVHATAEEAEAQVREGVEIYKRFFDEICVSYLVSKRPDWDKFAGAEYTIAFDMVCPDGRVLQIGTVHNLGQNFTKAFEIDYETPDGRREYAWSTSYGISGRAIAAPIILHGDDHGMVLPPKVAPIQVVVIPIPYKGREEQVVDVSKRLEETLKSSGIRARADLRDDLTPGAKFYYWEKRGVPIRAEIGPRDVDRREVTLVRRDTLERTTCRMDDVVECVKALMEAMTKDMRERAWEWLRSHVKRVGSLEEARQLLEQRSGVVELLWCGRDECGLKMEEALSARLLGTPFGEEEVPVEGRCVICGAEAKCVVRAAVTY
ncbi:MAG: proline--tRNA ligase [Thermoplasmata archaeon]|nr:MAG: proline--tRNA ligase [Thermoplasmata archaeon]HDI42308.1 proline--tRNA ligase [Candidatus Bathyarchaeota archaeon]